MIDVTRARYTIVEDERLVIGVFHLYHVQWAIQADCIRLESRIQ